MPYFGLFLSDMRVPNIENSDRLAAWSPKKEDLERLLEREKVESYDDGRFTKFFRAGGPLEWFNDFRVDIRGGILDLGVFAIITGGGETAPMIEEIFTADEYAQKAREDYERSMRGVHRADYIEVEVGPSDTPVLIKQLGSGG